MSRGRQLTLEVIGQLGFVAAVGMLMCTETLTIGKRAYSICAREMGVEAPSCVKASNGPHHCSATTLNGWR